jgi:plasmid stability protein
MIAEVLMPSILIRDLDEQTIKQLKRRATANGRSLQAEAKEIIERSAREKTFEQLRREAERLAKAVRLQKTDSVDLIREDRLR